MSFEKRVIMRPIGFESKKTTLARTIAFAIAMCMLVVLLIMRLKIVVSRMRAMKKFRPIKAPRVFGYQSFCCSSSGYVDQSASLRLKAS